MDSEQRPASTRKRAYEVVAGSAVCRQHHRLAPGRETLEEGNGGTQAFGGAWRDNYGVIHQCCLMVHLIRVRRQADAVSRDNKRRPDVSR